MDNIDIVFVILHFKAYKETIECINSIYEYTKNINFKIVIVDNFSNNGSIEKIIKKYSNDKNIDVVLNKANYGFSKGNNTGCLFAKRKYNPKFYFVLNNDTEINQNNIYGKISEEYQRTKFDVLGPDIITLNKKHQNPYFEIIENYNSLKKHARRMKIAFYLNFINMDKIFIKLTQRDDKKNLNKLENKKQIGIPLHGSALVFSKKYIEKFKFPFDKLPFLYGEEEYLFYRKKVYNLMFVYCPDIIVFHKEDVSSKMHIVKSKMRRRFLYKNSYKSIKKLILKIKKEKNIDKYDS